MMSILLIHRKSHLRSDAGGHYLPDLSARYDGDPKPSYECSRPTRPKLEQLVTIKHKVTERTVKT